MLKPKAWTATLADIQALPPNMVGEIVYGVLHAQARPAPRHGIATDELRVELGDPFGRGRGGPGGWLFIAEPELHLGSHVLVPDIAGWKRERLDPLPETAVIEVASDWVCEVLSPSTQALDRTDKLSAYAEQGVRHCWYVDPIAQTLEVMALTDGKWLLLAAFKDSDVVAAPPFEVHSFALDVLWVPSTSASVERS